MITRLVEIEWIGGEVNMNGIFELHDKTFTYHREYSDFDIRHIELVQDNIVFVGNLEECIKRFWEIFKESHSLMIQKAGTNEVVYPT